jgi:hypothetical protein
MEAESTDSEEGEKYVKFRGESGVRMSSPVARGGRGSTGRGKGGGRDRGGEGALKAVD